MSKDKTTHQQFEIEQQRVKLRRKVLKLEETPGEPPAANFGLALSGGGIRSATFALGVMQAMARAPAPSPQPATHLLQRFDYLSTVSGGGYIGAFFIALFLPDRNRDRYMGSPEEQHRRAAEDAYLAFKCEPPEKVHVGTNYQTCANPGAAAMAWLRENGRYLLPSGAGDYFYALAVSIRNLLSLHFVLGMPILAALASLAFLKTTLNTRVCEILASSANAPAAKVCGDVVCDATQPTTSLASTVMCETLWWLPALWLLLAVIPSIIGFWMVYSLKSEDDEVKRWNACSLVMLLILVLFTGAGYYLLPDLSLRYLFYFGAVEIAMGLLVFFEIQNDMRNSSIEQSELGKGVRRYRVEVTRRLSHDLVLLIALAFIVAVEHLTHFVYDWLACHQWSAIMALLGPALITVVRWTAKALDDKEKPGWLKKAPIELIAGVVGFAILLSIAVLWGLLVHLTTDSVTDDDQRSIALAILASVCLLLTISSGYFIGFINLSSLHAFYSSRLARTYLGASNKKRFAFDEDEQRRRALLSVTQAISGDDMPLETYYSSTCAPLHLINVTMNMTSDPAEQLVQRDRKGKPLCVAPGTVAYPERRNPQPLPSSGAISFMLDGEHRHRSDQGITASEINQPLNVSHWIATSGAALTTGLGRSTSLGTSLALGLANIRLGTWWPSRFDNCLPEHSAAMNGLFKTQKYLLYELTARFHGVRREYQYLSDGGHFENTGAYELLRSQRKVELIVLCDSGSDPDYQFDDLGNLIRLARIDQRLEIKVDTRILGNPILAPYFGRLEDFRATAKPSNKRCAVMLEVFDIPPAEADCNTGSTTPAPVPRCRILLIKPRMLKGLQPDVWNYAKKNPQFPNESTADQFFDEAQFESYRQLGLAQGRLLFGDGGQHTRISQTLWEYLGLV